MAKNLIFIVAYNHENFIEKVIARIPERVLSDPQNEVLVIDDGSKDNTFFVGDAVRAKYGSRARITILKNPINQGYGGNQKLGYRYAIDQGFDRVFMIHGDGQYAPELLETLIAEYESAKKPDAVFGTRMDSIRSARAGGMPFYKIAGNITLTKLQNFILGSKMSEFHSGYRSYSTQLLKRIPFERNANDFHFDTEIIIQTLAAGGKIVEVPIPTHYGEEICHVNGMKYAKDVIRASLHYKIQKLGFFYDRKFDIGNEHYPRKESPYSSHARLVDLVPPGSRVLDIGCGTGHLANDLIKKGCMVDGIDMIEPALVRAPLGRYSRIDLIREMPLLKDVLATGNYDVILMADVLEHLVEPDRLLDMIRESYPARKMPRVIASTGNVAFFIVRMMLFIGQFNYGVRGILDRTHTRLFTRRSFLHLFEQSGYTSKMHAGIPMPFSAVFRGPFGRILERLNAAMLKLIPGFFSYQSLIEASPLPTPVQLLELCADHSHELRRNVHDAL